jgi:spermidine/putrescine transport system permease protein
VITRAPHKPTARSARGGAAGAPAGPARVVLALPLTLWMLLFVAVPGAIFLVYSFWQVDSFQIVHVFTWANYRDVFTEELYRRSLWTAFLIGGITAIVTCLLAFPLAWAVRFHTSRWRDLLVLLIVISSVSSYLARLYAWRSILGADGVINYSLERLGLIHEPLGFLIFNRFAMVVALAHIFLPFAFLPIYGSLLAIRPEVLQASRVLGAGPIRTFSRVAFPLASSGFAVSFIYVLIFATGDYAVPAFLGGPQGVVAARVIADQFGTVFNWPLGAALSIIYMLVLGAVLGVFAWLVTRRARRLAG